MLSSVLIPTAFRHDHLYEKIESNVIRSDALTDSTHAMSRLLLDSRVILCTLSMLSSEYVATVAQLVPIQTVIIDEASQIEVGDYLPMLYRFPKTLSKLIFIGDDKQCTYALCCSSDLY